MRHELPESIARKVTQPSMPSWPPLAPDAVFFGTFNPITQAHTQLLEAAHIDGGYQAIWVVPAFGSPFKHKAPDMTDYTDRLTMTQLACQRYPWAIVSPIESWLTHPGQPCYSSAVVAAIIEHYRDLPWPLPFIIGIDAVVELPRWQHADGLVEHCEFLVAPRPGNPNIEEGLATVKTTFPSIRYKRLSLPPMPTSSSSIRATIQWSHGGLKGETLDLHTDVWHYIESNGLYGLSQPVIAEPSVAMTPKQPSACAIPAGDRTYRAM